MTRRKGTKAHRWSLADDMALMDAAKACSSMIEHYERQGYAKGTWWDAVAGRLAPDIIVTGKACARRYSIVRARLQKQAEPYDHKDAWDELGARIDRYEQELSEAIYDMVERIDRRMAVLMKELGVE